MTPDDPAPQQPVNFLGVHQSITNRCWIGPDNRMERLAETFVQKYQVDWPLAQVLAARRIRPENMSAYLSPTLRDFLPDPHDIKDMSRAASRFIKAVTERQRIAIFADYDVDGGSSAALLSWWLKTANIRPTIYVPDRETEGYGPNPTAMRNLDKTHDLIICVDCGTMSHHALSLVTHADVLVLDHHQGIESLPPAFAVVNPNRYDESGELGYLCAAAIVFLMLVEVQRQRRANGQSGQDLTRLLDLVALATVADVSPLIGVNRAFVRQGLKVLAWRKRPGLKALADVANLNATPSAGHLGFTLGPRINAAGRMGQAHLGARLLSTDDPDEAEALALRLNDLNAQRRKIEEEITALALAQASENGLDGPLVWAAGEGWNPGIVGIVAARLTQKTDRPAVVIGLNGDMGKGSGRSVPGIDLGACIVRLSQERHLLRGGGHKMAVGLTIERKKLDTVVTRLSELLARQGAAERNQRNLTLDGLLMPGAATPDLVHKLEQAGPFGSASPAPRFAIPDLTVTYTKPLGDRHLKLNLAGQMGETIHAIAFNAFKSDLGSRLSQRDRRRIHIAGRPDIYQSRGRNTFQFQIQDAALAQS